MLALDVYKFITAKSEGLFSILLHHRAKKGKEDIDRLCERKGITATDFPDNSPLLWFHAASVGEAQSALILINLISNQYGTKINILLTSGTVTSANFVKDRLPQNTIHKYFPLDHPLWVKRFLDSVNPSIAFWVESELWPNMLIELKNRSIPAILINGRMSEKSFKNWQKFPETAKIITSCFDLITVQTENDGVYYSSLGAKNVKITDNLKYSAKPLAFDQNELAKLKKQIIDRKIWLYSSTHDGEEILACKTHKKLKQEFPDILTIIAPRHPARTDGILSQIQTNFPELNIKIRANNPETDMSGEITQDTDIYLVNTMGELGLFYYLSPIACIGRSFSNDGGGGHNPIEAAILDCAVLSGKNTYNFNQVYSEMEQCKAYTKLENQNDLAKNLRELMRNGQKLKEMQERSRAFATEKNGVAEKIMDIITPYIDRILTDYKI